MATKIAEIYIKPRDTISDHNNRVENFRNNFLSPKGFAGSYITSIPFAISKLQRNSICTRNIWTKKKRIKSIQLWSTDHYCSIHNTVNTIEKKIFKFNLSVWAGYETRLDNIWVAGVDRKCKTNCDAFSWFRGRIDKLIIHLTDTDYSRINRDRKCSETTRK